MHTKVGNCLFAFGRRPDAAAPKRNLDELEYRLLDELIDRCARAKIPLVLATFDLKTERRVVFDELTSQPGVVVLDLQSKSTSPQYYYKVDEHLNALGHAYVAEQLATVFTSQLQDLF